MFHTLHRIEVLIFWGLLLFLAVQVYRKRAVFYPLVDLVDAIRIKDGFEQRKVGEVTGQVVRVLDGDTFQIKDEAGRTCNIRLTGLDAPDIRRTNEAALLLARESKTNLSRLILSNRVRVEITYSNRPREALGIVYLGDTNVNASMVASGLATAKRDFMNGLPLKERYALIRAE